MSDVVGRRGGYVGWDGIGRDSVSAYVYLETQYGNRVCFMTAVKSV